MKAIGIKNAHPGAGRPASGVGAGIYYCAAPAARLKATGPRALIALLLAALVISAAAAPVTAAALEGQGVKESNNKIIREAMKAIRSGRYEDAISLYGQVLSADKNNVQAHVGAALAHLKSRDYRLCFQQAGEAIKADPTSARARALAGLALLRSGYINNAVREVNEAFKLDSKEPMAYWAASEIDYYEGRPDDARIKSYRAHVLDRDEPDYLITFARASSQMEMFKDAADAYDAFLRIAPQNDKDRRDAIKGLIQFYRRLGGVNVHQISGAAVAEVPFRLGGDRRPYIKVKVNGRDATFVIDTGSGFTVISKDSAKRLGVSEIAQGGKSQAFGGDGKFLIVYGLLKSLELGETKVKSVPCYIQRLHYAQNAPPGERADGYIGLSVLTHFLTQLDYKENVMRLDRDLEGAGSAVAALPEATVIPFRRTQNGLISIETEFNGNQRINAILDSGASSMVISAAAVERFNLRDQIIKGQTVQVFGAAGVANDVELLFLPNCRVADIQQSNLRALVLDFGAINETTGFEQSGILGGDFLRHFRVTIDFSRALLAFQPNIKGEPKGVAQPDSQ
ncbi:MAG TPA: aspartyl protease family protein [Blastocatellia bacterium]|nr:aspartyl protease family protein [Blastocatellia bacterium]